MTITADKMLADLNAKTVTYTGNVIVTQGDIKMHAGSVKVTTGANGKRRQDFRRRQGGGGFARQRHRDRRQWHL